MNTARQDLTLLHDNDLRALGTPEAEAILEARAKGAAQVRLVLARMYGDPHRASFSQWNIVAHLTDRGTIGVIDVADGTAWDSGVKAEPEVEMLGLDNEHTPDINHPSLVADVRIDGQVVQRRGETPESPITAPAGWRRIGLPSWRGYYEQRLVPEELYTPKETWIRPTLRAFGLTTCYGKRGKPRRTLDDAAGHGAKRPWITPRFEPVDPFWWPMTDEQRAEIRALGREWLDNVIEQMFPIAGLADDHSAVRAWRETPDRPAGLFAEQRITATLHELSRAPGRGQVYSPEGVLDMVVTEHLPESATWLALRNARVVKAAHLTFEAEPENMGGGSRLNVVAALLRHALWNRLLPVATHLAEHVYGPLLKGNQPTNGVSGLREALTNLACSSGQHLLSEISKEASKMEQRVVALYYKLVGPEPVYVDQPAADAPDYREDA